MLTLGDLAKIELGSASYASYGQVNGMPAANLAVYQLPNANSLQVSKAIRKAIEKQSIFFDKDIKCRILYDTTDFVKVSIHELLLTLFLAAILVVLVVFIFLQDWRATLIPTLAIPVSLIGTFPFLFLLDYTINTISLFAILLAIGIVVDDAIVVVENVNRIMKEEDLSSKDAAIKSMKQVTGPIIATTLVLLAEFIPIAFFSGITGKLYRQFAVTISISIIISSITALTLSPALCSCLLKPANKKKKHLIFRFFDKCLNYTTLKYNRYVSMMIRKLTIIITLFVILLLAAFYLYDKTPTGFVPNEDQGAISINIQLPNAASIPRTKRIMKKVETILKETKGVSDVISFLGYSLLNGSVSSNAAFASVVLENWSKRQKPELHATAIINKLNKEFATIPGAQVTAFDLPPIIGLGMKAG